MFHNVAFNIQLQIYRVLSHTTVSIIILLLLFLPVYQEHVSSIFSIYNILLLILRFRRY